MTNNTDRMDGWVYFIRAGDAIKIGFSAQPKRRILDLQTSHHVELELLAWVPTNILTEREAHQRFGHLLIRGEWYQAGSDLMEFISTVAPPAPKVATVAPIPSPIHRPRPATKVYMTQEIRALIAKRNAYGADTPEGHACSNLIEQAGNMPHYVRPEWATDERQTLPWLMQQQMKRLAALKVASN